MLVSCLHLESCLHFEDLYNYMNEMLEKYLVLYLTCKDMAPTVKDNKVFLVFKPLPFGLFDSPFYLQVKNTDV